jgi:Domain of Unknown Function (DUF928)
MSPMKRWISVLALVAFAAPAAFGEEQGATPAKVPAVAPQAANPTPQPNATQATADKPDAAGAPASQPRKLQYRPPVVGKPARSVGGGSRGVRDRIPVVYVLVPDHVGQTTSAQPSLFWFIDRVPDPSAHVEFTLLADGEVDPVVEKQLAPPDRTGIHRIRLADLGVKLEPGKEYEWSVAVVMDPGNPSRDVVATGWIDRVERPELKARLDSSGGDAVYVFAEEGLWYDALGQIGDDIDRAPNDKNLRDMRASLLEQVGLGAVVASKAAM